MREPASRRRTSLAKVVDRPDGVLSDGRTGARRGQLLAYDRANAARSATAGRPELAARAMTPSRSR